MRQAVIYLRVSTIDQTTANQERELREVSSRMGREIIKVSMALGARLPTMHGLRDNLEGALLAAQ
jgi:DNA invertase Pin-like site-specific DNA recombinase